MATYAYDQIDQARTELEHLGTGLADDTAGSGFVGQRPAQGRERVTRSEPARAEFPDP
jgi:hypothetical protein